MLRPSSMEPCVLYRLSYEAEAEAETDTETETQIASTSYRICDVR